MSGHLERRANASPTVAAADVGSLLRTLRDAARDVAEARARAAVLEAIVSAHAEIVRSSSPADIVDTVLRVARASLGFERVMWLDVEPTRAVVIRKSVDRSEVIDSDEAVIDYDRWSSIAGLVRGQTAWSSGRAAELGAPIVDVRNWYALVPVGASGNGVGALVYADGHKSATPHDWLMSRLLALADVASTAIDRATLVARLHTLADRDPLTGLYNRRAFNELLHVRIASRRIQPFVFVIIDVDDFKAVNDSRGHAVGDSVLQRLARSLQASSRADDVVGRYAGDEFVVILDGGEDVDADVMLARLSAEIRSTGISCSIGAAWFPTHGVDAEDLFAAADRALYVAKARGKNRYELLPPSSQRPESASPREIEASLRS